MNKIEQLSFFFQKLDALDPDSMTALVERHLNDEELELFVRHIEDFYGIEDDEEIGMMAQLMVTGYLAAKSEAGLLN